MYNKVNTVCGTSTIGTHFRGTGLHRNETPESVLNNYRAVFTLSVLY